MNIPDEIPTGSILLYFTPDIIDEVIAWDEAERGDKLAVSHVEVYAGAGRSWASRNGIGIGIYAFRSSGLVEVRQTVKSFVLSQAQVFFDPLNGSMYGWSDILRAAGIDIPGKGMDCSHFAALLEAAAGCPQFDDSYPANEIKPSDFQKSRESQTIW